MDNARRPALIACRVELAAMKAERDGLLALLARVEDLGFFGNDAPRSSERADKLIDEIRAALAATKGK